MRISDTAWDRRDYQTRNATRRASIAFREIFRHRWSLMVAGPGASLRPVTAISKIAAANTGFRDLGAGACEGVKPRVVVYVCDLTIPWRGEGETRMNSRRGGVVEKSLL